MRTIVPNDRREPAQIIAAAEKGEAWAQNWVGVQCLFGNDVPKDPAKGVEWIRKAAMQGDREAQSNLGECYWGGEGVEENPTEAENWYRKAADQGQDRAQMMLGFLSDEKDDLKSAIYWYRRSAEQGNGNAQNNLAVLYHAGKGVPTSYVEAYKWYNLAAAQKIKNAIESRGEIVKEMTREQIAEGQRRTAEFVPNAEVAEDREQSAATDDSDSLSDCDVTHLIERLEAFEDHLKAKLEALNAQYFLGSSDNVPWLRVCGELHTTDGMTLKHQVKVVVDAYDSSGKLLNTGWQCLSDPEKFYGFETFTIQINVIGQVGKVRVYPKRM
jgi:tetratricopeptide (TPR) repeat protein